MTVLKDLDYVTLDDPPGEVEAVIIPINEDWGRVILTSTVCGKSYRLGVLSPRAKDLDPFVAGAKLAGWVVIDERSRP